MTGRGVLLPGPQVVGLRRRFAGWPFGGDGGDKRGAETGDVVDLSVDDETGRVDLAGVGERAPLLPVASPHGPSPAGQGHERASTGSRVTSEKAPPGRLVRGTEATLPAPPVSPGSVGLPGVGR